MVSYKLRNSMASNLKMVLLMLVLGVTAITFGLADSAYAQGTTGSLRGQVMDSSQAAVPLAAVTVTNQQTGVVINVTTTSAGTYSLPSIIPGMYSVAVQAKGFKSTTLKDVSVVANQENVADVNLEIGSVAESVEVVAGAVEIQTTTSTLNNTYDSKDVIGLPQAPGVLNGSPLNLALLAPNVIAQPGGTTGVGGSVGGTRPRDNNFTIDGVDDNNFSVAQSFVAGSEATFDAVTLALNLNPPSAGLSVKTFESSKP